ncbi:MAG: hypothetical protein IPP88_06965 [Betaproteobacteria bacterium]|nr:hypothetical protein [Betaproteobacteria bacterium]
MLILYEKLVPASAGFKWSQHIPMRGHRECDCDEAQNSAHEPMKHHGILPLSILLRAKYGRSLGAQRLENATLPPLLMAR